MGQVIVHRGERILRLDLHLRVLVKEHLTFGKEGGTQGVGLRCITACNLFNHGQFYFLVLRYARDFGLMLLSLLLILVILYDMVVSGNYRI